MPKLVNPKVPRQQPQKRFYSVDEYCAIKDVSRATVYNGMRSGAIPYDDTDGHRKIPTSFIDRQEDAAYARAAKLATAS